MCIFSPVFLLSVGLNLWFCACLSFRLAVAFRVSHLNPLETGLGFIVASVFIISAGQCMHVDIIYIHCYMIIWILSFYLTKTFLFWHKQAREAAMAVQGKMVDSQRKKSKGW